jgi:hypothetical protein
MWWWRRSPFGGVVGEKTGKREKSSVVVRSQCLAVETAMGGQTGIHWHTATPTLYA